MQTKKLIPLFTLTSLLALPSYAVSTVEGEYLCDDCHGFLTIKANKPGDYKVRLIVGGGSCGGDVFVQSEHVKVKKNRLLLTWKSKQKICTTEIFIEGSRASVSDSCIDPEDEDGSTCAVLGDYTKRVSQNVN